MEKFIRIKNITSYIVDSTFGHLIAQYNSNLTEISHVYPTIIGCLLLENTWNILSQKKLKRFVSIEELNICLHDFTK